MPLAKTLTAPVPALNKPVSGPHAKARPAVATAAL